MTNLEVETDDPSGIEGPTRERRRHGAPSRRPSSSSPPPGRDLAAGRKGHAKTPAPFHPHRGRHRSDVPKKPRPFILLVEHDASDAQHLEGLLVAAGRDQNEVVVATTLSDAMVKLVTLPVDAVLLDLRLPDAFGVDCVRGVRAVAADLPIVVLTSTDEQELALACIGAGAQDYVSKADLGPETLRRALEYATTRIRERAASSRLRVVQDHLASIVEASRDAIFSATASGIILSWNVGAEQVFGYKKEQAIGKAVREILGTTEEQSREYSRRFLDTGDQGGFKAAEVVSRRRDGETITLSISSCHLRDTLGSISGIAAVCRDVTESKRRDDELRTMNEALLARDKEMRALASRLNAVREEESTRIARAVHDELGQLLTALKLDLAWISKQHDRPSPGDVGPLLNDAMRLVDRTLETVQRIATELRASSVDDIGLAAAIVYEAERFERRSGITTEIVTGEISEPGPEIATAIFRICQELLTNVARHANARYVRITLDDSARAWLLLVEDDGVGIPDLGRTVRSLGILGMRERAESVGGELVLERGTTGGTIASLRVPHHP